MASEERHEGNRIGGNAAPRREPPPRHGPRGTGAASRRGTISRDAPLVSALRRRDEAAFAELLDRHGAAMQRLAAASLPDRSAVEDVVQEAWLGVLDGIDRFEERCSLKTWIFRILQNRIRTRLKRNHSAVPFAAVDEVRASAEPAVSAERFLDADHPRWPFHWKIPPASWGESPEETLLSGEARAQLERAVTELPAAQRTVITMRDIEGWTSDEVCEVLDITPGNQRVLLHRARSKVRQALEDYFRVD